MKQYTYAFADGEKKTVEVSDELFEQLVMLDHQDYLDNLRETRRHTSLQYLEDNGVEFVSNEPTPEEALMATEQKAFVNNLLSVLTTKQRAVYVAHYSDGKSLAEIAREMGISFNSAKECLYWANKKILKNF